MKLTAKLFLKFTRNMGFNVYLVSFPCYWSVKLILYLLVKLWFQAVGIGWSFAIQSTEILLNGIMTEIHPVWINDIEIGTCIEHGGIHYIAASPRGGAWTHELWNIRS